MWFLSPWLCYSVHETFQQLCWLCWSGLLLTLTCWDTGVDWTTAQETTETPRNKHQINSLSFKGNTCSVRNPPRGCSSFGRQSSNLMAWTVWECVCVWCSWLLVKAFCVASIKEFCQCFCRGIPVCVRATVMMSYIHIHPDRIGLSSVYYRYTLKPHNRLAVKPKAAHEPSCGPGEPTVVSILILDPNLCRLHHQWHTHTYTVVPGSALCVCGL